MTTRTVLDQADPPCVWLDLVQPTVEELSDVARIYGLHPTSVQDCLDPEHLPKYEVFENYTFVILRAYDREAPATATTVQELTRKLALFYGRGFLITIHRTAQPWLATLEQRKVAELRVKPPSSPEAIQAHILAQLLNGALDTYLQPMEQMEARLDEFDTKVFAENASPGNTFRSDLRAIHRIKRQVTICKRLFWRTVDMAQRMVPTFGTAATLIRDVQENAESFHFYADELLDEVNTLLSVQLALASHRTSEVMRVLTVFSVFFLPLTFIVGVYGMNFDHMPELRVWWGYPAVLLLMASVTLVIHRWFRRRGWLRR